MKEPTDHTPHIVIAIDGPAGAGKSTIGKLLAARLGALYIDTGAMYRTVALKGFRLGVIRPDHPPEPLIPEQEAQLTQIAQATEITLAGDPFHLQVFADREDVSSDIRLPEVSRYASIVSAVAGVRSALVAQQRRMGAEGTVVMDGRDIGTHVFPDADVKFFLDASVETRTERRYNEQRARGIECTREQTRLDVLERDRRDYNRAVSPLRRADDAIWLDTSTLSPEQVLEKMLSLIHHRLTLAAPVGKSTSDAR
ncbi:MAG: (d)CMP kinase [Chloracidobacterium sp.]|uniref:Cytidylate kinase n=1 Tax=Chloracidobacterium validum TaxID=2821543 RepID=A0ABX8B9L2_9BACT|nr:(d)CMP kinase [Chloracidobacterium validum]QUW02365.1 (d)CMP kinase [Chloracidobacterium validum]